MELHVPRPYARQGTLERDRHAREVATLPCTGEDVVKLTGRPHWHRMVALASLTVAAAVVAYTRAICPHCGKLLYLVPGDFTIVRRRLNRVVDGSGRGRVLTCTRCRTVCEVSEHRRGERVA